MSNESEELKNLPDAPEFMKGDLKVLEEMSWQRAAYQIWFDTVKADHTGHSLKWSGMFSARALHSVEMDSRTLRRLTWVLVFLTVLLCFLTFVLAKDVWLTPQTTSHTDSPKLSTYPTDGRVASSAVELFKEQNGDIVSWYIRNNDDTYGTISLVHETYGHNGSTDQRGLCVSLAPKEKRRLASYNKTTTTLYDYKMGQSSEWQS